MDERLVTELEAAVADAGALLIRARKYRRGAGDEGSGLLGEALALGDAARRLHRHEALDAVAAGHLLVEARELLGRIRALLASVHGDPTYRTALAAHAAGDQATLARTLPLLFAGLGPVTAPPALFHPVPWRRRGRPRAASVLAADVVALLAQGLAGEGDDLSPGVDPALPAVVLQDEPPADEPVVLRLAGGVLPLPVYRLEDTGEYLVYTARLYAPATAVVASQLDAEGLEDAPADYPRFRDELCAALIAAGVPLA